MNRRAFTLTELMVAVSLLIVVILATSKIFGTASRVTSLGQATSDVLQEAVAIERQLRADLADLDPAGIFAIRSVAVPNDINWPVLLNPNLPADATIRADQLLFFTKGVQSIQTYRGGAGTGHKGQSAASRIYYGPAYQLPEGRAVEKPDPAYVQAHDPDLSSGQPILVPWYTGPHDMVWTVFRSTGVNNPPADYTVTSAGAINASQPEARQWLLARQAVALADDGGNEVVFLFDNRSANTIADPAILNGRVDAAATQLNDIRNVILGAGDWNSQRALIASALLRYPRAERVAPGMHRVDQALTNHVISSACSSFRVEWTYDDGVGAARSAGGGVIFSGVKIDPTMEQPWFGLEDADEAVFPYGQEVWWEDALSVYPEVVEWIIPPMSTSDPAQYLAIFGYNQERPLDDTNHPNPGLAYTPWPSAIRITMRLHDRDTRLENGRVVQFVIRLPRHVD